MSASPFGINFGAVFSSCTGSCESSKPVGVTDLDLLPDGDLDPGLRRLMTTGVAYIGGGPGIGIPGGGGGIMYGPGIGIDLNLGGGGEKNLGRTNTGGGGGCPTKIGRGGGGPRRINTGGGGRGGPTIIGGPPFITGLDGSGGSTIGSVRMTVVVSVGGWCGSGSPPSLAMLNFLTSVLSLL